MPGNPEAGPLLRNFFPIDRDLSVAGSILPHFYNLVVMARLGCCGAVHVTVHGSLGNENAASGDMVGKRVPVLLDQGGREQPEQAAAQSCDAQKHK